MLFSPPVALISEHVCVFLRIPGDVYSTEELRHIFNILLHTPITALHSIVQFYYATLTLIIHRPSGTRVSR
ncbi:uncharacterized, partial [Tachysurus ichikawai]